uniref:Endoplasmic reticulum transmembrane protein n=1 Tax=Caenorhabditis tropicalis TaxID=1561998 RepID=A0A1I7UW29_9PELO
MDYATNQPLGLETPKLWIIPARPLVCVLAFIGCARGIASIFFSGNWEERVTDMIFLFLNVLLLFGAARNNECALKWSQRVVFLAVVLAFIQFLIWPVVVASYTASGMADKNNTMADIEDKLYKTQDQKKKMFVRGLMSGFALEIGTAVLIGAEILKYVLVNRLWKYAKSTENIVVGGNQYIVP